MKRLVARLTVIAVVALGLVSAAGVAPAAAATPPDPGDPGPLAVTSTSYTDGNTAFTPPGFGHAVEVTASVKYPTGLPAGPYPLIVLLHGRHITCNNGSSEFLEWPCSGGNTIVPSYQGYDYLMTNLASWGYIVVSVSANGINAFDNNASDLGALARAQLIQHHLEKWQTFNTTGGTPFGSLFVGKVDLTKVGTMGHSRGGEGVVRHFVLNASQGSPFGIKAVLPLAPVDFSRPVINNVPLYVMLPYCDGDVNDLQGIHFYDDARYNVPGDQTAKQSLLVMGANHNYFNTIWTPGGWPAGAIDDWSYSGGNDPQCGPQVGTKRITPVQQRSIGLAYMAGFFRLYVGGETDLLPYFDGSTTQPASTSGIDVHAAYHAPDSPTLRRDVNRFLTSTALTTNQLGGAVTKNGVSPQDLCGGDSPQPQTCISGAGDAQQPHTTPSFLSSKRGLSQLRTGWSAPGAFITNAIPAGTARDVSGFDAVTFRVALNFSDTRNPANMTRDFHVEVTDGNGATSSQLVSASSDALFYPPGNTFFVVPKVVLNTVRVPLSGFSGVDLTNIASVTLRFDSSTSGALLLTDLAFAKTAGGGGPPPGPELSISDFTKAEGTSSTRPTPFRFTITLSSPSTTAITVKIATANGTAVAPADFKAIAGKQLKIKPGKTSVKVTVQVIADSTVEPTETFTVNLSNAVGATITDGQATGTITNDD